MLNGQLSLMPLRWFEQMHSPWAVHSTTMWSLTDACQTEFICYNQCEYNMKYMYNFIESVVSLISRF